MKEKLQEHICLLGGGEDNRKQGEDLVARYDCPLYDLEEAVKWWLNKEGKQFPGDVEEAVSAIFEISKTLEPGIIVPKGLVLTSKNLEQLRSIARIVFAEQPEPMREIPAMAPPIVDLYNNREPQQPDQFIPALKKERKEQEIILESQISLEEPQDSFDVETLIEEPSTDVNEKEVAEDLEPLAIKPKGKPMTSEKKIKRKKSKKAWIKLGIVLAIILGIFITFKVTIYKMVAMSEYLPSDPAILETGKLVEKDGTMNILFIGTDEFSKEFAEDANADCIMIISLNLKTGQMKIVSFERGIVVPIAGKEDDWLAGVFPQGGGDLMVKTAREQFDIDISYYVRMNMEGFKELMESAGGVTVWLAQDEAQFLAETSTNSIQEGLTYLNGADSLAYARLRSVDNDYYRVRRQHKIVQQALYQLKGVQINQLYEKIKELLPYVQTNIPPKELVKIALKMKQFIGVEMAGNSYSIPEKKKRVPSDPLPDGRSLLNVDFDDCAKDLHYYLYEAVPQEKSENTMQ